MVRRICRASFGALVLAAACDSGAPPSSSVVGDWSGRVAPAHFDTLMIRLQQSGGRLTGTACFDSSGIRVFHDAPVTVDYPNVRVEVLPENTQACCAAFAGWLFVGQFTKDGLLDGVSVRNGGTYPMALSRGGDLCANSRVLPPHGFPPDEH